MMDGGSKSVESIPGKVHASERRDAKVAEAKHREASEEDRSRMNGTSE